MADCKADSDDDITDNSKEANHSDNYNRNSTQYIKATHLFKKTFIYLLMAKNSHSLIEPSKAQHFILNHYIKMVF